MCVLMAGLESVKKEGVCMKFLYGGREEGRKSGGVYRDGMGGDIGGFYWK